MTLLRRIFFDLTGLPPSTQDIKDFQESLSGNPSKCSDRLLNLRFGERWGRYRLDVARYADTTGEEGITPFLMLRYRDYVISSFNKDKPFDQFTWNKLPVI